MKKVFKRLTASVISAALPVITFAQAKDFSSTVNKATSSVKGFISSLVNFATVVVFFIGIVMIIWNYAKSSKGDPQSHDSMFNWIYRTLITIAVLQIINVVAM